jgi:UDP-N-acetylmuramoyl-tripeptide--D-alanyl-D-alanine ligase
MVTKSDASIVEARLLGQPLTFRLGTPGRHIAMNSLSVLAAALAIGANVQQAASTLSDLKPPVGRGERTLLRIGSGEAILIDESYNANPASVRAALATLGSTEIQGRRIAVLGDMLELGRESPQLHAQLAEPIAANNVDLVFAAGGLMQNLVDVLPAGRLGAYAPNSAELVDQVCGAIRPGDAVMIKGSNSIRMALVVKALKERYGAEAPAQALKG